ncbi:MAG: anthranilate synthase component I [Ignavibacteriales bacterium]|nr:anthranilate synthase component I [Ignavibacteriales bacterium]
MDYEQFEALARERVVVPVYERIAADLLTPVSTFLRLREPGGFSFLLESVDNVGGLARYSFIGRKPSFVFSNVGGRLIVEKDGERRETDENIFDYLRRLREDFDRPALEDLPDFAGGVVGYLGFENVALIEDVITFQGERDVDMPDSIFGVFDVVVAFDHHRHQAALIANARVGEGDDPKAKYDEAKREIAKLKADLAKPIDHRSDFKRVPGGEGKIEGERYCDVVEKCKRNIYEGDVFQIVPSLRFSAEFEGDLLNVYRALRIINPSPYMYYMEFGDETAVVGASPEDLLKVTDRRATILPIAGTRKRGEDAAEDEALERDLLDDPKEIAEHVMLVDLARNDLGRVCEFDSVRVSEKMKVKRYSHVMHIVSRVEGILREDRDCVDALKAAFPAGTVSGAPKIRAVQLIDQYERLARHVYAGAVGYVDFSGNLDLCIAIRTFFAKGNTLYWQAGAGVVADSVPENELREAENKAAALARAVELAEVIDENPGY